MQLFAYRNTEAGIRALHKQIATFETATSIEEVHRDRWKTTVIVTPFQRIMHRACKVFGVTPMGLRSARQTKGVADARHFIFYWAVRLTPLSQVQIGRLIGGRDHTTVHNGRHAYVEKRAKMGRTLRPTK